MKLYCRFCGKDITGRQISCWPHTGYMCYECSTTKYADMVKMKAEDKAKLDEYLKSLKPRDRLAWFLEKTLGYETNLLYEKLYFTRVDSFDNTIVYYFEKESDTWFLIQKGNGLDCKYNCNHLSPYKDSEGNDKLGFWYKISDMEKFLKNEADSVKYTANIIVACKEDSVSLGGDNSSDHGYDSNI